MNLASAFIPPAQKREELGEEEGRAEMDFFDARIVSLRVKLLSNDQVARGATMIRASFLKPVRRMC